MQGLDLYPIDQKVPGRQEIEWLACSLCEHPVAWGQIKKSPQSPAQSQTGSVSHFFGAKCETTPGLSSTGKLEEPSTSSSHDAGHTQGIRNYANNPRECIK